MHAPQVLQQRREHVQADGHAARQAQRAAQLARAVGDRANRFADVLEDALPELDEAFGRRRHPDLAADAQEQRLAELLLEQQDLPADRRLRDVQLPAAGGERAGLGDRLEDFELSEVHGVAGAEDTSRVATGRSGAAIRQRLRRDRGVARSEREMRDAGGEEADEPGVVVQRLQRRHDEAAPRERAADRGRAQSRARFQPRYTPSAR